MASALQFPYRSSTSKMLNKHLVLQENARIRWGRRLPLVNAIEVLLHIRGAPRGVSRDRSNVVPVAGMRRNPDECIVLLREPDD